MKAWRIALACLRHPTYRIILCADSCIPPSPWTDFFRIEIDDFHKVIRLSGDFI